MTYSVITPLVETFPILPTRGLLGVTTWFVVVNQRLLSGPVVIDDGAVFGVGIGYSVKTPPVVTFAIMSPSNSVIQRLPSGPTVIPSGPLCTLGKGYSVSGPA